MWERQRDMSLPVKAWKMTNANLQETPERLILVLWYLYFLSFLLFNVLHWYIYIFNRNVLISCFGIIILFMVVLNWIELIWIELNWTEINWEIYAFILHMNYSNPCQTEGKALGLCCYMMWFLRYIEYGVVIWCGSLDMAYGAVYDVVP